MKKIIVPINEETSKKPEPAEKKHHAESDESEAGEIKEPASGKAADKHDAVPCASCAELRKELEASNAKIAELESSNKEFITLSQQLKAEFENYKKRVTQERANYLKYASSEMAGKLLGVLDNLHRAFSFASDSQKDSGIMDGIRMIEKQIQDLLAESGVAPFESVGQKFDPNLHESFRLVEVPDGEDNIVVDEIEKGYMIYDRVLRYARVGVSKVVRAESTGGD